MKVKVNDQYNFDVEVSADALKVDGRKLKFDAREWSATQQHIIYQHKSYHIELVEKVAEGNIVIVKINGNLYRIALEDQYDGLLKKLGLDNVSASKVQEIRAPMPGLVLNVMVIPGQEVIKGDSLLVLEAMKMENLIKSPASGTVKQVLIKKGDKVDKNEVLIQFA